MEWLDRCLQSWDDYGFEPFTVNAVSENVDNFPRIEKFGRLQVQRDGSERFKKKYVPIADMMQVAAERFSGPVAIVNADILLELSQEARERIHTLKPGNCIVVKRFDVQDMTLENAEKYRSGYDFFVFHSEDLARMPDNGMYFGLPWWDHFIPVSVINQGVKRLPSDGIDIYHLLHTNRWKRRIWRDLGSRFLHDVLQAEGADTRSYSNGLSCSSNRLKSKVKTWAASSWPLRGKLSKDYFLDLSDYNIDFIDG